MVISGGYLETGGKCPITVYSTRIGLWQCPRAVSRISRHSVYVAATCVCIYDVTIITVSRFRCGFYPRSLYLDRVPYDEHVYSLPLWTCGSEKTELRNFVNFTSSNVSRNSIKRLIYLVFSFVIFHLCDRICRILSKFNCFITRFRAAVSVLVGPCCPALLHCIDANVHTVVLLRK